MREGLGLVLLLPMRLGIRVGVVECDACVDLSGCVCIDGEPAIVGSGLMEFDSRMRDARPTRVGLDPRLDICSMRRAVVCGMADICMGGIKAASCIGGSCEEGSVWLSIEPVQIASLTTHLAALSAQQPARASG
jgi:hypothetical protein